MTNMLKQSTGWMVLTKAKSAILASLIVGVMALPFIMPVQKAQANNNNNNNNSDQGENPHALPGTWIVQVSLDPPTPLNFMRLETYGAGGGFVESNNGPGAGQPPGQGNWVRIGQRQYASTELRLGFNTAHIFTGITKIRSVLTLSESGDEFTTSIQTDIFLPGAVNPLPNHPSGTSHGIRVPIEPLN